jgi:hypothetical protein
MKEYLKMSRGTITICFNGDICSGKTTALIICATALEKLFDVYVFHESHMLLIDAKPQNLNNIDRYINKINKVKK